MYVFLILFGITGNENATLYRFFLILHSAKNTYAVQNMTELKSMNHILYFFVECGKRKIIRDGVFVFHVPD